MKRLTDNQLVILGAVYCYTRGRKPFGAWCIDRQIITLIRQGRLDTFWKGDLSNAVDAYLSHLVRGGYMNQEKQGDCCTWQLTETGEELGRQIAGDLLGRKF